MRGIWKGVLQTELATERPGAGPAKSPEAEVCADISGKASTAQSCQGEPGKRLDSLAQTQRRFPAQVSLSRFLAFFGRFLPPAPRGSPHSELEIRNDEGLTA